MEGVLSLSPEETVQSFPPTLAPQTRWCLCPRRLPDVEDLEDGQPVLPVLRSATCRAWTACPSPPPYLGSVLHPPGELPSLQGSVW